MRTFNYKRQTMKNKLIVLTGAGMSAESGIKTFRDADGLWEGHDVQKVATPQGFQHDPDLVHEFYNQRRRQLLEVKPNPAHEFLAELESDFDVHIITQNVDDLHERAGSSQVLHLHGELLKIRSLQDPGRIMKWKKDLTTAYKDDDQHTYRPHIVWFGEAVPMLEQAAMLCQQADLCIVIGTSLQVYPAASLLDYCPQDIPIYYIDPNPGDIGSFQNQSQIEVLPYPATQAIVHLEKILGEFK